MPNINDRLRSIYLNIINVVLVLLLVACSSGGGGGSDDIQPPPTGISGTVTAPGGAVAKLQTKSVIASLVDVMFPSANATLSGTSLVSGANVDLVRVDANGVQVAVIDSTTTDMTGTFSFDTEEMPNTTLVLVIDSGSAVMRAIVAEPVIEVNPSTEYVLQQIETAIAADPALDLSDFTVEEVQNMVDTVAQIAIDVTGTTIADAVAAISTQADATIGNEIAIASIDLAGTWHYYETVGPNTCGDPVGSVWAEYDIIVEQVGSQVTVHFQDPDGTITHVGHLDGLQIVDMPLDVFPEGEGVTTITSQTYDVDPGGNYIAASYGWSWTQTADGFTCSGTDYAAINRQIN